MVCAVSVYAEVGASASNSASRIRNLSTILSLLLLLLCAGMCECGFGSLPSSTGRWSVSSRKSRTTTTTTSPTPLHQKHPTLKSTLPLSSDEMVEESLTSTPFNRRFNHNNRSADERTIHSTTTTSPSTLSSKPFDKFTVSPTFQAASQPSKLPSTSERLASSSPFALSSMSSPFTSNLPASSFSSSSPSSSRSSLTSALIEEERNIDHQLDKLLPVDDRLHHRQTDPFQADERRAPLHHPVDDPLLQADEMRKLNNKPHKFSSEMSFERKPPHRRHRGSRKKDFSSRKFKITCKPSATDLLKRLMGGAFNARYMSIDRPHDAEEPVETEAKLSKAQQKLMILADDPLGGKQDVAFEERLPFHVKTGYSRVLEDEPTYRLVSQRRLRFRREKSQNVIHRLNKRTVVDENIADEKELKATEIPVANDEFHSPSSIQLPVNNSSPSSSSSSTPSPDDLTQSVVRFLNSIGADSRRRRSLTGYSGGGGGPGGAGADEEVPWKCESRVVWEDLGANYFPRYLRTVECLGARCWFGHFKCSPKAFTVKVLKRQSDQCVPVRLPPDAMDDVEVKYEEEWVFEERSITFCCECVQ